MAVLPQYTEQVPQPMEFMEIACLSANVAQGSVLVAATSADLSCQLPSGADTNAGIIGLAIKAGAANTTSTIQIVTAGVYRGVANGSITRSQLVTVATSAGDVKAVSVSTLPGATIVGMAMENATNGQPVAIALGAAPGVAINGGAAVNRQVRVVASANVTLATGLVAGQSIDSVVLAAGDRVLLANQTTAANSGVYIATAAGAGSFAPDYVQGAVLAGMVFEASEGTVWANSSWKITAAQSASGGTITVGTTDPVLMPRTFKATVAIGTPNTAAWVAAATSPIALNDTTSSTTGTKAVLVAGRGNGSITLTGTGTDSVNCGVFNWG